jgi:hypothetical protein
MTLLTTKCRSAVARRLLPQAWALAPAALLIPFFVQSACLGQPGPASEGAEFGTAFGETRDLLPGTAVPQAAIANETEPLGSGSAANPALAVADETAAARSAGLGPREPVAMPAAGSEGVVGLSAAPAPILTGKPARIGVLDVLGKLAIVAALVYVSVFGLRSVWQRRLGPAPAGRDLRVRERASLGGSRCL